MPPLQRGRARYHIYERTDDDRTLMWLTIQHVGLTIPGHQTGETPVTNQGSDAATYLVPVTVVASIRFHPDHGGDYAAYIGVAPPSLTTDLQRVTYIALHGNKIEGALAERLFRVAINRRFGKDRVYCRA